MNLIQKSKSSLWHVFFYIIIIPLSLVTLLFTPYLIGDIFGVNFDYVDINFSFKFNQFLFCYFHLPKSSLLMLVAAFIGYKKMMDIYEIAIAEEYRFLSYGDAMLLKYDAI